MCYDCDICANEQICIYAWQQSNCPIIEIKESKQIVDEDFIDFYNKMIKINEEICNDTLTYALSYMNDLIINSKKEILKQETVYGNNKSR